MGQANNAAAVQDIRDVKPVEYPRDHTLLVIVCLAAVVLIVFLVMRFLKYRKHRVSAKAAPSKAAWEIALEKLEALRREDLVSRKELKKYYTVLGDIIRRYFEQKFNVRAPEMTTQEFLEHLAGLPGRQAGLPHLNASQKETLKDFMNSCDMVKFAKFTPEASFAQESFRIAQKLIEETK